MKFHEKNIDLTVACCLAPYITFWVAINQKLEKFEEFLLKFNIILVCKQRCTTFHASQNNLASPIKPRKGILEVKVLEILLRDK